jgi:ribonuclease PH
LTRKDGRSPEQIRPLKFTRRFTSNAPGSVLIELGNTKVLCTAAVTQEVPKFLENAGKGWVTAEYAMLPASTDKRKPRERAGKVDGRSMEIQRLVGRAMRSVVDLELLGERTIWFDCDVLQADGGTRTASITAAYVAAHDCFSALVKEGMLIKSPLKFPIAAVSVGIVKGQALVDLDYPEDSGAEVDMNIIMTGKGDFVEIQGTAEGKPFPQQSLLSLIEIAKKGIDQLFKAQAEALKG